MLDRVFVYGTLQRGGSYHHLVEPFLRGLTVGSVPGVLLDLGAYPGWVAGPGTVHGQILRLRPIALALEVLDALEEYQGPGDPDNLYRRVSAAVSTAEEPLRAWGYLYVGSREGYAEVPGGRWPPHGAPGRGPRGPGREAR